MCARRSRGIEATMKLQTLMQMLLQALGLGLTLGASRSRSRVHPSPPAVVEYTTVEAWTDVDERSDDECSDGGWSTDSDLDSAYGYFDAGDHPSRRERGDLPCTLNPEP
jgi:hypothetical protein